MGMPGYTKLFNSILASTIWLEDNETRIVWITMLAMADKNGLVEASMPGLAAIARVSQEACQAALVKLEAPDQYSRSKDFQGRRVQPTEGGWQVLNHAKYRAKMSADERREYNRIKQREFRGRQSKNVNDNLELSALSAHTKAEAKADSKEVENTFRVWWESYPRKVGKEKALTAWKRLSSKEQLLAVKGLQLWKCAEQWNRDAGKFIPHGSTFLREKRYLDEPWTGAFEESA